MNFAPSSMFSGSDLLSRHRLGDTEVSGQTSVFIEVDSGDNRR